MAAFGSADRVLMYLVKSAVRAFYYFKSSDWVRTRALVTGHTVSDLCLGAPDLKLFYKYDSSEGPAKGSDLIPFQSRPHAKYYAESFPHNLPRIIRVNPKNPQETRFFERDQKGGGRTM
jgi:hypothetical protein